MKKFLFLALPLFLLGCEKSYPTYYDIDGEFVIDQVIVISSNGYDTIYYSGKFSMYDAQTPLDSFTVGVTRFKFTNAGRTFKWNKQITPIGGDPWVNSTYVRRQQSGGFGDWDVLNIYFELNGVSITRKFTIDGVGVEDFQSWITQYPIAQNGPTIQYKFYFHEVGP